MKIIKTGFLIYPTLLFILMTLQSCYTVRNFHNDAVDIGFLSGKGEGSLGVSFDINDETAGASGNFMISPAENLLVGAAISAYSYKVFHNDNDDLDDFDLYEESGQLKGYKFRGNIGYYNNFGPSGTGYVETMLTLGYGKNTLNLIEDDVDLTFQTYEYNPFSVGIQLGAGKNMKKVGLMGGMKFQRYFFDQKIPAFRTNDELFLVNGVSFLQLFYGMRFGGGPVKGTMQIGLGIDPEQMEEFGIDPIPNFSFGVSYVFGRTVRAEEKSF